MFVPPQTPFPRARDGQNLISWRRLLPLPTNPVWWGSTHAISNYRGNRPTHKYPHLVTHPATNKQTGPITIHCAAASAQCNENNSVPVTRYGMPRVSTRLVHADTLQRKSSRSVQ